MDDAPRRPTASDKRSTLQQLLARVQRGDGRALGELLERHRAYLKMIARRQLSPALSVRVDESDMVQRTCMAVQKSIGEFHGATSGEFIAWLKVIHERVVSNAVREHVTAARRAIDREQPMSNADAIVAESSANDARPSQRLMADERAVALAAALDRLPRDQCEAVRLRYLEGLTLTEIAAEIQRSESAVAGLLKTGNENTSATVEG